MKYVIVYDKYMNILYREVLMEWLGELEGRVSWLGGWHPRYVILWPLDGSLGYITTLNLSTWGMNLTTDTRYPPKDNGWYWQEIRWKFHLATSEKSIFQISFFEGRILIFFLILFIYDMLVSSITKCMKYSRSLQIYFFFQFSVGKKSVKQQH